MFDEHEKRKMWNAKINEETKRKTILGSITNR
jgi:hypothetical protein